MMIGGEGRKLGNINDYSQLLPGKILDKLILKYDSVFSTSTIYLICFAVDLHCTSCCIFSNFLRKCFSLFFFSFINVYNVIF